MRRDFRAAAERFARIVDLENPDSSTDSRRCAAKQDEFYVEGRDKGVNAALEVAIELARLESDAAHVARTQRGAGRKSISGIALAALGERESGTARLEEAVAAYRAALEEQTRERAPLDWAMTQNNLGNALGRSASGRAGRRGSRRRSRPIARRWRNGRASGFRSTGR